MASKKRNALAELAEEMKEGLIHLEVDTVPLWVEVYGRAQRIIAELAKVPDCTFSGNPRVDKSVDAVIACRAIAEEGEKK